MSLAPLKVRTRAYMVHLRFSTSRPQQPGTNSRPLLAPGQPVGSSTSRVTIDRPVSLYKHHRSADDELAPMPEQGCSGGAVMTGAGTITAAGVSAPTVEEFKGEFLAYLRDQRGVLL